MEIFPACELTSQPVTFSMNADKRYGRLAQEEGLYHSQHSTRMDISMFASILLVPVSNLDGRVDVCPYGGLSSRREALS